MSGSSARISRWPSVCGSSSSPNETATSPNRHPLALGQQVRNEDWRDGDLQRVSGPDQIDRGADSGPTGIGRQNSVCLEMQRRGEDQSIGQPQCSAMFRPQLGGTLGELPGDGFNVDRQIREKRVYCRD